MESSIIGNIGGWQLGFDNQGKLFFQIGTDKTDNLPSGTMKLTDPDPLQTGFWYNIGGIFNGGTAKLFKGG